MSPKELVPCLSEREAYADRPERVELEETHISWVFLTDRLVFKIKKPVRFSFLDYSTLDRRRAACDNEIALNSRLAPRVYRKVTPVTRGPDGRVRMGGEGTVIEYAVEMERLPADRMLDELMRRGQARPADIEQILRVLVAFYSGATRSSEIDGYATAGAIEANARDVLSTLESADALPQAMFRRVRAGLLQFVKLHADEFQARLRAGKVCEGHGDLRPEHVCLLNPPVVFDCVEFSLALRSADVASDLAFLAMEFDFSGAPELSRALLDHYRVLSGDDVSDRLAEFYKAYRACIRAKVSVLRAAQQSDARAADSVRRAKRYLELASSYANAFYRPKLLVMVGAAGTGKSTLARALAPMLGMEVLRSDAVRQELAGQRESGAAPHQGIYSESMTDRTYAELFRRAGDLLAEAASVVLDATFQDAGQRRHAEALAQKYGAELRFMVCRCSREVAMARIADRNRRGTDISDARPELFDGQQRELDLANDLTGDHVIPLDTAHALPNLVSLVVDRLTHPARIR